MTIKCIIASVASLFMSSFFYLFIDTKTTSLYCDDSIKNDTVYDVNGIPVFCNTMIDSMNGTVKVYYFHILKDALSGEWAGGVEYNGGNKKFESFCDSLYFNRADYNYDELNASAYFTVLFDKELKIKEVRILNRLAYDNKKYDYDNLIRKIIFLTEGQWIRNDCDKQYNLYFYFGRFNVR